MSFQLPSSSAVFSGVHDYLSNNEAVRQRQISRINAYVQGKRSDAKTTRALRKAAYKHQLAERAFLPAVRNDRKSNPRLLGTPRFFKILTAGSAAEAAAKLHDASHYVDEGQTIFFSAFGVPGRSIRLNNTWIKPSGSEIISGNHIYNLLTTDENGKQVGIYLDFIKPDAPTGFLETHKGHFALKLLPGGVNFNVSIAGTEAGATYSSGDHTFKWDPTSPQWQGANWEANTAMFSYNTVSKQDPFSGWISCNQIAFEDVKDNNNELDLTYDEYGTKYSCVFVAQGDGTNDCSIHVDPSVIPSPPAVRANDEVTSIYPEYVDLIFDELGQNFTGAFIIKGATSTSAFAMTGTSPTASEVVEEKENGNRSLGRGGKLFHSALEPISLIFKQFEAGPQPLPLTGLLNNDCLVTDSTSPSGYRDVISQVSNNDFHNIICYYMDTDIHTTFVSSAPTTLDAGVEAIATNSVDNAAFYKTLQVPYVVTSLAGSTLSEGKECNGARAQTQLKTLPANSSVYQKQSDALYRYRYMQSFSGTQAYLDDQAKTDYSANMSNAATEMKASITSMAQNVSNQDTLAAALQDIDDLHDWASGNNLFYAFYLYYWCVTHYLPGLYASCVDGTLSKDVSRQLKKLTCTFGILELGQQNPKGKSFQEAFNSVIRDFQMQAIIPQLIDANSNSEDIDSLMREMLAQFYSDNEGTSDPTVAQEAQNAQLLAADANLRANFYATLVTAERMGAAGADWGALVEQWGIANMQQPWYQSLANAAEIFDTFSRGICIAFLVLPMLNSLGGWNAMTSDQKAQWIVSCAALGLTIFIKTVQGVLRVATFWSDLGSIVPRLKAFFGFSDVMIELPEAAVKTQSSITRWFVRIQYENMEIAPDDVTLGMKIFGRSAGEFLTFCLGAILAGLNLALSVIDAVKTDDPLQKAMDAMMIISSGFQLLAIGAGWLVSAGIVTGEGSVAMLEVAASFLGPAALVFAVIGVIIMIVLFCLHRDPPNPVQDFIDKYAAPAGLKADNNTAIDDMNVVPADSSNASLNGISLAATAGSATAVLQLGNADSSNAGAFFTQLNPSVTYLPDTCWAIQTDYVGNSIIFTYAKDSQDNLTIVCLTEMGDGTVGAQPPPSKTTTDSTGKVIPVDPAVYNAKLAMQQWTSQTLSGATTQSRTYNNVTTSFTTSIVFSLKRSNKTLYLVPNDSNALSLQLTDSPPPNASSSWTLTLQTMGPADLQYVQTTWSLLTNSSDEHNDVTFEGPTSLPLTWTITPALPPFLQFDDPNVNEGSIKQVSGTAPTAMSSTVYTIAASITIAGSKFSKQTTVTISVGAALSSSSHSVSIKAAGSAETKKPARTGRPEASTGPRAEESQTALTGVPNVNPSFPSSIGALGAPADVTEAYQNLMATAPAFFKWQQTASMPLNQHYTAAAAISQMQNSLSGSWYTDEQSDTQTFVDLYFPDVGSAPPLVSGDSCNYGAAANAFVAQSIHNGDSYANQYCNYDATQTPISTFNATLLSSNIWVFFGWLAWWASDATTGGKCNYQDYVNVLTNPYWIAYKRAEQTDGTWENQSMEMFFHFLKLMAIGASDQDITNIYNTLTTPNASQPTLDPGGFSDITASTWQQYTGYITSENITCDQLNVQNLGHQWQQYFSQNDVLTYNADEIFLRNTGYLQSPPSGCCFPPGTSIVLSDGVSTKPIETIEPGESVLSPTGFNPRAVATVVYLSRPMQQSRPLYAFARSPEIKFTATHPILLEPAQGQQQKQSSLSIGFVEVSAALLVNPLWRAFQVQEIDRSGLLEISAPTTDAPLFDLVLSRDSEDKSDEEEALLHTPITFVVQTPNGSRMPVCSETPVVTALPAATKFIMSFVRAISVSQNLHAFFPKGLTAGVLDYAARIRKYRTSCSRRVVDVNGVPLQSLSSLPAKLDMMSAVSVLSTSQTRTMPAQTLADAVEAITMQMGLSLQAHLDNGWQFGSVPTNDFPLPHSRRRQSLISMHFIELAQPACLAVPESLLALHQSQTDTLGSLLAKFPSFGFRLYPAQQQSDSEGAFSSNGIIHSLGPRLYHSRADVVVGTKSSTASQQPEEKEDSEPDDDGIAYTVTIDLESQAVLSARGTVGANVLAKWPLYLGRRHGATDITSKTPPTTTTRDDWQTLDLPEGHPLWHWPIGWLSVTRGMMITAATDQERSAAIRNWTQLREDSGLSSMDVYAELLGHEVGKDIVEGVIGY